MNIYLTYNFMEALEELQKMPPEEVRLSSDQAIRIKAIMDRAAQEIKRITGENPQQIDVEAKGIIFVKRYSLEQQILVENKK